MHWLNIVLLWSKPDINNTFTSFSGMFYFKCLNNDGTKEMADWALFVSAIVRKKKEINL